MPENSKIQAEDRKIQAGDSKIQAEETDLGDLARKRLKARYKDEKLAKIVEMIIANAGNYLTRHHLFDIKFGIPLFGDGDIGKEGPVQFAGKGNLNPKFKLLLHYEDAVTKFLDDTLFWAQGKPILGLLSTELMWKYTVFDGIVIIFLLYHLIYADNSKESAEQVDPFEDLLKAYKNKLINCFGIVPILSVLPPPSGKEQYKGDGVRAKQVKERLESIQVD